MEVGRHCPVPEGLMETPAQCPARVQAALVPPALRPVLHLPKIALIFSHFRLVQNLEKTLFSGNPIMTFLSNFTVTAGEYVI